MSENPSVLFCYSISIFYAVLILCFPDAVVHASHPVSAEIECHIGKTDLLACRIDRLVKIVCKHFGKILRADLDTGNRVRSALVNPHAHLMKSGIQQKLLREMCIRDRPNVLNLQSRITWFSSISRYIRMISPHFAFPTVPTPLASSISPTFLGC